MKRLLNISLCLIFTLNFGYSQSIKRNVISSFGASSNTTNLIVETTFGQPPNIGTISDGSNYVRQGFQQPLYNFISTPGCTDPTALNYDPLATVDDGSCCYSSFGSVWNQIGQDIDGEAADDKSGHTVSMSSDGNIVAIGAPHNDGNGLNSGHVRVYEYNGSTWNQIGQDIDGESINDYDGWSVSLNDNGNILAIGAQKNDGTTGNVNDDRGHIRVYEYNGSNWIQIGQDIDGLAPGDEIGMSISLSNDGYTVASGSPWGTNTSGYVRIYNYNGSSWNQLGQDIVGEAANDQSGNSVSLSSDGNTLAIGAYYNDANTGTVSNDYGHVRIYNWSGTSWNQVGQDIDGEAVGDQSGHSVSLNDNGDIVAIGAPRNIENGIDAGHVRIYENNGGVWTQIGNDIDGISGDQSGHSVSLSSNGYTVAIAAPSGTYAGTTRIYHYINNAWTQLGQDVACVGGMSGYGLSLSSDGSTVAVGSPYYVFGVYTGHVGVYGIETPCSSGCTD
jgi:hypothetical protein